MDYTVNELLQCFHVMQILKVAIWQKSDLSR